MVPNMHSAQTPDPGNSIRAMNYFVGVSVALIVGTALVLASLPFQISLLTLTGGQLLIVSALVMAARSTSREDSLALSAPVNPVAARSTSRVGLLPVISKPIMAARSTSQEGPLAYFLAPMTARSTSRGGPLAMISLSTQVARSTFLPRSCS